MSRRALSGLIFLVSVGLIWFATQIVDQSHGPDPGGKLFVASWLESELWVNPWLLGVALVGLIAAALLFAIPRRRTSQGI
jgi:hypothetical protein